MTFQFQRGAHLWGCLPVFLIAFSACTLKNTPVRRGQAVYQANCISCHNPDPRLPGSVGPEIWGSPRELLEARLLRAEYPPGYAPKRPSKLMPKMPQLERELDSLHAFVNPY